jgi:hypothetical protein
MTIKKAKERESIRKKGLPPRGGNATDKGTSASKIAASLDDIAYQLRRVVQRMDIATAVAVVRTDEGGGTGTVVELARTARMLLRHDFDHYPEDEE